jgi:hypothetical protein
MAVKTLKDRKRVDARIRKIGKQNKLNENQINFVHTFLCDPDPKIRNNQVRSYLKTYPNSTYNGAISKSSLAMRKNQKIIKTIEQVLEEVHVTQKSVLEEQLDLIKESKKHKNFGAAVQANKPMLEIVGLTKKESTIHHDISIDVKGLDQLSTKELHEKMESLLNSDVIDGEYEIIDNLKIE